MTSVTRWGRDHRGVDLGSSGAFPMLVAEKREWNRESSVCSEEKLCMDVSVGSVFFLLCCAKKTLDFFSSRVSFT